MVLWDFGDGTTTREENPIHIYNMPGVYTIRLYEYLEETGTYRLTGIETIRVYDFDYGLAGTGAEGSKLNTCIRYAAK